MPVDAVGGIINPQDTALTKKNSINQEDFIKLFLAQLQFQDPMEPVDNREFLAQLAQFTALEQSRQTSENTNGLLSMNASTQAISLLNKQVEVQGLGVPLTGKVTAVSFTSSGAMLSVTSATGEVSPDIRLSQVTLVRQP
jgi:flagellar basal-body rod modification protein FlgD